MWQGNEKHKEQLLQCQQHTERLGAMLSARSWDTIRVFSPLVRCFLCSLCIKAVTGCFSCTDCLRQVTKLRGKKKCHLKQGECHFNPSFSCLSVPKGEARGVNKSTHQNKPCGLCCSCRVRPWTWHQSQSFSQPFALLLSNRALYSQTKAGHGTY